MTFRFPRKCSECEMEGIGRKANWVNETTGVRGESYVCRDCGCEMEAILQ